MKNESFKDVEITKSGGGGIDEVVIECVGENTCENLKTNPILLLSGGLVKMRCSGKSSCLNGIIEVDMVDNGLTQIECVGNGACKGMEVDITEYNFGDLPFDLRRQSLSVECGGDLMACDGLTVGCPPIYLGTSETNASFCNVTVGDMGGNSPNINVIGLPNFNSPQMNIFCEDGDPNGCDNLLYSCRLLPNVTRICNMQHIASTWICSGECGNATIYSGVTRAPNAAPSQPPTAAPSRAPTRIPLAAPSNSPTEPSLEPTSVPTRSPSVSPTSNPSGNPISHPSRSPVLTPSFSPTDAPSSFPTDHPSSPPSNEPSTFPTNSPLNSPSDSPSISPTSTPTRNPVESFSFDGWIKITISLAFPVSNSSVKYQVSALFEKDSNFQKEVVEVLEKVFFEASKSTGITYEDFQVVLLQVDEIQLVEEGVTNDPRIEGNENSQRRLLQSGVAEIAEVFLVFEIWCSDGKYGIFQGAASTNDFQNSIKTRLRDALVARIGEGLTGKGDSLTLAMDGFTPLFETETFWEQIKNDPFLLINVFYIFSAVFICLLAFIHSKTGISCGKVHAMDKIQPMRLLTFFLLSAFMLSVAFLRNVSFFWK